MLTNHSDNIGERESADTSIYFNPAGNTVAGRYFGSYDKLMSVCARRSIQLPYEHSIHGSEADIARLAEYVDTFANCIRPLGIRGWRKACALAGVQLAQD